MTNLFLVALGGAIGASLRYGTTYLFKTFFPILPFGTLFVNVLGSFLIGLLIGTIENKFFSENFIRYFVIIGILGSYTTFSAFSIEVVDFYNNKKFFILTSYVFASFTICILAAYFGYNINKH